MKIGYARVSKADGTQPIDTTIVEGKLFFRIFATLSEYERDLIIERTRAGLVAARSRGRMSSSPPAMTKKKLQIAMSAINDHSMKVLDLCE